LDEAAAVKWEPITKRIKEKTGSEPESFALGVYDAVWVVAKALISHRGRVSFDDFTQDFPEEAGSFFGTTGWTILDAAGDRQFGNFDFWAIREVGTSLQWTSVARYNSGTKEIVRAEP
jgi:ABC-type branched-subunit amino acid transport system substrate-binding protein